MDIEIKKYSPIEDYEKVLEVIELEGDEWKNYLKPQYQKSLERSITYVAYVDSDLCGYSRSMNDLGFYIWVLDLLVLKKYRGNSIGKKLLGCIAVDYPDQEIFIMSDVNEYYEKLGYKKEGTIFKLE